MQGDYMALRFEVMDKIKANRRKGSGDGYVVLALDENRVATFSRIDAGELLVDNEIVMQYRVRDEHVKLTTDAFFFQEGDAKLYAPAKYGEFRVADGMAILTRMRDEKLSLIGPN
jgi:uncharacterized membrane-anchored protein